jgi:predicted NUDIX family phosphoesterase
MISICTTGCSLDEYVEMGYYLIESEATDKDEDKYIELTEEERKLLVDHASDASKERVGEGKLESYEKSYLEKIRGMKNYLKKKYPSYDIELKKFSISSLLFSKTSKYLFELIYDDESYSAEISFDSEDNPTYKDDFFAYILRMECDTRITKLLQNNESDVHSYTSVGVGLRGDDVDENTSIDEYRVLRPDFEAWTYIYIEQDDDKEVAEQIRNALIKEEISDVYVLMFIGNDMNVKYADTYTNRRHYPYYMFKKGDIELKKYDE